MGKEITRDCAAAGVLPTHFVCGVGTGGCFTGVMNYLRSVFPDISGVAVEIEGQHILYSSIHNITIARRPHRVEGLSTGELYANTRTDMIDEVLVISEDEAWSTAEMLARTATAFVGPSSGANVAAAISIARSSHEATTVITVLFDAGWKYALEWPGPKEMKK